MFVDLDFSAMKETQPDELFAAWLYLPDGQRDEMDAEFRDVFELSCEKGFRAIIDEAGWYLTTDPAARTGFVENLAALSNHYERAMVTFLDHNQFWKGATRFYHAVTSRRPDPHLLPPYRGPGQQLRGRALPPGRIGLSLCLPGRLFAAKHRMGEWGVRPPPAQSRLRGHLRYSRKEGSLDLNFRGSYKGIEPLQEMFATAILKLPELPLDPKDERVYDLNPLRQKGFDFVFDTDTGIQDVAVKKLRLSSKVKKGDRITLEADAIGNPDAVYELLDKVGKSIPLHLYNVTQVELAASVTVDADKPPKAITIRITHPNSCSLKYDELDLKLRDMLKASGIEPKEPAKANEAAEAAEA